ncbi:uncharacterized protein BT62DRAFT_933702, partial [Guyanagaster necrorhizus]
INYYRVTARFHYSIGLVLALRALTLAGSAGTGAAAARSGAASLGDGDLGGSQHDV